MKVLFVYPNIARNHSPQAGVSSLAGTLMRAGHESGLFDITFMAPDDVAASYQRKLEEFQPDIIGISCRSTEWETAKAIMRFADNGAPIVVGGPHATIAPEEVIADERVKMLVRGEGEEAIVDLLDRIGRGADLTDMPNLWIKQDGNVFRNDVRPLIQNLDEMAMPSWEIWDDRHFRNHFHQVFTASAKVFGDLETSRGCPYCCPYCLTPVMQEIYRGKGKYHREKSADRIVAEINKLRRERNIDYVRFVDETFILNRKRLRKLCQLFEDEIQLPFSFSTRPETLNEEIMKSLAGAGANCVSFGLESGNEDYRREMLNRKTKQQEVIDAVALAKKYGVKTFAFVMIGLPHETRGHIQDTLELIHLLQPDMFQITIFYPFEGTPFYKYCLDEGLLEIDHERLTEIWKGSVLNQPGLPSTYLVRLRELMFVFARLDKRWWPLMTVMEKQPAIYWLWFNGRRGYRLGRKILRRLSAKKGPTGRSPMAEITGE